MAVPAATQPTMTRTLANCLGPLLVALALLVATGGEVRAHAVLIDAQPEDGASLDAPPDVIELRFSEPVAPIAVRLIAQDGRAVPDLTVEAMGETVRVRAPEPLPPGGYFLSYRVTSLDAHAVGATLRFGIGAPAPGAAEQGGGDAGWPWLAAATRWLVYVAALGAAGAALFGALLAPPAALAPRVARLATALALAAFPLLLLRLGVAGLDLAGLPLAALASLEPWQVASATSLAPASALTALGLAAIAAARRLPAWAPALGAAAVAGGFALTGHAASAMPRLLTAPALWLHVLCAGFWLGALVPLLWSLRLPAREAGAVLARFSTLAMAAVTVLAVAGGVLAWIQLDGDLAAFATTAYGQRLLLKLALVAGLLALAVVNRLVFSPGVAAGRPSSASALRRSLAADLVLALGVLAVTATFPFSPPPRALAETEAGVTVLASGTQGQALLTLIPGRIGPNRLQAGIADRDGAPVLAREASVAWSLPEAGIEPVRGTAAMPLPGGAVADGILLPQAGRWRLRLDLLVDDFTKLTYEGEIDVR